MKGRNVQVNKKGQLNTLAPAVLALVFAAIVLVFGLIMTQGLVSTQDGKTSDNRVNETILSEGDSIMEISTAGFCGFGVWNASLIVNLSIGPNEATTNETLIEGADYTIFAANGSFANLTSTWNRSGVTYDYTWGDTACEAGNLTVVGLGTFADFWEIIVLAVVIAIVIGLLLVIFGGTQGAGKR